MAGQSLNAILHHLRQLTWTGETSPDADLLHRFAVAGDETAFEVLVWRHASVVLGVCRRVLRQEQDAEDAFQATFLALARRAGSLRRGQALASWLHRVAFHVALRARTQALRRVELRPRLEEVPAPEENDPLWSDDVRVVLDEEINRLPQRYRLAVILCYLEGRTQAEAARVLGCPPGTIGTRLAWARQRLRTRLRQRGLGLSVGLLVMGLGFSGARAGPTCGLVGATAQAAMNYAAGQATAHLPAHLVGWAEGVLRAMFVQKLKVLAAMVLSVALVGTGTYLLGSGSLAGSAKPTSEGGPPTAVAKEEPQKEPPQKKAEPEKEAAAEVKRIRQALDEAVEKLDKWEMMIEDKQRELGRFELQRKDLEDELAMVRSFRLEVRRAILQIEQTSESDKPNPKLKRLQEQEDKLRVEAEKISDRLAQMGGQVDRIERDYRIRNRMEAFQRERMRAEIRAIENRLWAEQGWLVEGSANGGQPLRKVEQELVQVRRELAKMQRLTPPPEERKLRQE